MSSELIRAVSAEMFYEMVLAGAANLDLNKENINKLNVFPVPDGDTGTNMAMTMQSAAKFVKQAEKASVEAYASQMALGSVMGARGNSGVILSQILTGISKRLQGIDCISPADFVEALNMGSEYAYKAVTNPMEGTILTVVREAGDELQKNFKEDMDFIACLDLYLAAGRKSLERTPELLPVLKQAGVVDAGGAGYLCVMEGMRASLLGEEITVPVSEEMPSGDLNDQFDHFFTNPEEIVYPYCTEFLIRTNKENVEDDISSLKQQITTLGDCMLVVGAGNTIKVHIHTDSLAEVLGFGSALGELDDIKINNMRSQNKALTQQANVIKDNTSYKDAILVVCNGNGFGEIFKGMGATHIISGGQTMNPSTEDFLNIINEIQAEQFFILPNNGNVVLTAQQAADLSEHGHVKVIPSKTFPQGIASLMAYMPEADLDTNYQEMLGSLKTVQSGEITQAVRDTNIDGVEIKKDAYLSILDGKIIASVDELDSSVEAVISVAVENDAELISLYYGDQVSEEDAEALLDYLSEKYEDIEFEMYDGGQSVYHYIISAE